MYLAHICRFCTIKELYFSVSVTCDVEKFTMTVCYEPHDDITLPDFTMFAENYGQVEACKAVNIAGAADTG